uniref:PDZ domain-containing protein n=1 Tax=Anopheles farauti TaxID=69004 RepID=A0A182Q9V5_9DIPT
MQLKPSPRCPALQYLDDVDPGGVADLAGLKPGDFLLSINNEDVTCASHEHVVGLIRKSGSLVSMTVVTLSQNLINSMMLETAEIGSQHSSGSGMSTPIPSRQCSTLPRRMNGGLPGGNTCKQPAPMPPRRDPKTTLSVGRARAKSMVAGLEGGGEKGIDEDDLLNAAKSTSAESIHQVQTQLLQAQQCHSAIGTPTQTGPGTPVQPRTASIKSRPTSSRITAAELEELFQRQQGADANRCSMLMSSSRFQSTGFDSGAGTPPISPQKGPIVYASVAEMKRKKSSKTGMGTLKGRPIPIPQVGADLKRTFHSTPDLASMSSANQNGGSTSLLNYGSTSGTGSQLAINTNGWYNTVGHKGHRSQDDMHSLHMSLQRLNLPPPNHPPPPPPVGQVVKVDVSRGSEYECLTALRKHIAQKAKVQSQVQESEVMSSFKPASNAKLYASPQDIRNVGYRTVNVAGANPAPSLTGSTAAMATASGNNTTNNATSTAANSELCKTPSLRSNTSSTVSINSNSITGSVNNVTTVTIGSGSTNGLTVGNSITGNQYAQPGRPGADGQQQVAQPQALYKSPPNSAPPLPEPDYSLSESDPDEDNSVRLVRTLKKTNGELKTTQNPGMAAETSGNSNTSGSSTGSSSMPQSFSVEEIQKIRTKLKSSKSYPNDFLRQQNSQQPVPGAEHGAASGVAGQQEEGDNSSSGVSSDQEITITCNDAMKQSNRQPLFPKQQVTGGIATKPIVSATPIAPSGTGLNEPKKVTLQLGSTMDAQRSKPNERRRSEADDDDEDVAAEQDGTDSPSPPATGFQRHNSLTRKQAATLAANRAKANQQNLQQRHAVTLATLPPPIEAGDSDEADSWSHSVRSAGGVGDNVAQLAEGGGMVVLAPPPEFSDSTVSHMMAPSVPPMAGGVSISVQSHRSHQHMHQHHQHQHVHHHHQHNNSGAGATGVVIGGHNPNCKRVRIVGAVPKVNRMNSQ